jgi:hypothetical protein
MVAIDSQFNPTVEKHSTITTKEINKIYAITMQSIKFNTSREVMLLLLVAPIWLTTPAHAHNKPGSQFDPDNTLPSRTLVQDLRKQENTKQIEYENSAADKLRKQRRIKMLRVQDCANKASAGLGPINQRLNEETSRTPKNSSVIKSLKEQRLEILMKIKRCSD